MVKQLEALSVELCLYEGLKAAHPVDSVQLQEERLKQRHTVAVRAIF